MILLADRMSDHVVSLRRLVPLMVHSVGNFHVLIGEKLIRTMMPRAS